MKTSNRIIFLTTSLIIICLQCSSSYAIMDQYPNLQGQQHRLQPPPLKKLDKLDRFISYLDTFMQNPYPEETIIDDGEKNLGKRASTIGTNQLIDGYSNDGSLFKGLLNLGKRIGLLNIGHRLGKRYGYSDYEPLFERRRRGSDPTPLQHLLGNYPMFERQGRLSSQYLRFRKRPIGAKPYF